MNDKRPTGGVGLAYLRVSDAKQELKTQRTTIEKWLTDYGLEVSEYYQDVGSRLEAFKRESFQKLLKRVEKGGVPWIVVEALDRFGVRSASELGKFVCILQDAGTKLYAIREGIEVTEESAFVTLTTSIGALRSSDELHQRSSRALKGRVKLARSGEHGGGPPPYAFAVQCVDRLGVELWRLEYTDKDKRVQLWPDGRRVPFDGARNTPKKNPGQGETLRLVQSIHPERLEWVKKIFEWYVTESIAFCGIATRLNHLGVDALTGQGWSGPRVQHLLENPIFVIGATVGMKTGRGKVLTVVNGQEQPVQRVGGKTGRFTKREETDYIYPSGQYKAIISQEVWQKAQEKNRKRSDRAPISRNPNYWLSGLLVCGKCGLKMSSLVRRQSKEKLAYMCGHKRRYKSASACGLNRVSPTLIERLLERYMDECGIKLDLIATRPVESMRALTMVAWSRQREYLGTIADMVQVLQDAGIETHMEVDGQSYETCDVKTEYKRLHAAKQEELAQTIKQKEEELRGFVRNIPKLSSETLIQLAEEEMDKLAKEIEAMKKQALPLDEKAEELRRAIRDAQERVRAARAALANQDSTMMGEAVRKVVKAIVCYFEPTENPGMHDPTTRLVRVVVEPLEGDLWDVVPDQPAVCRRFVPHNPLYREFAGPELA